LALFMLLHALQQSCTLDWNMVIWARPVWYHPAASEVWFWTWEYALQGLST